MKINILGTEYNVIVDDSLIPQGCDGLCRTYSKEIIIKSKENMLCPDDSIENKECRQNEVARHEIVHAFFSEAGLEDYSNNEQLVDWIATQFPKLVKIFTELGCM